MLAGEGILGPRLAAVHCTRIEPPEIELLAEAGAAVVHCPRSNASLGCGAAPLAELLEAGVRVGLGTDSPASAPSFDVFAEMRAALLTARAREGRPDALTARDVLRLATLGSAEALGLEDEVGSLTPGKRADLAIVSFADSAYLPWDDPEVGAGSRRRAGEGLPYHRGWRDAVHDWRRGMARASAKRGRRPSANARNTKQPATVDEAAAIEPPAPAVPKTPKKAEPKVAPSEPKSRSFFSRKPKKQQPRRPEDTMFFTRLRTHAKWVFVMLAVVFSVGFLAFGVGTGGGGSVGDAIRGIFGGDSGTVTLASAQQKVDEHPNDPEALLQLATLQQRNGLYAGSVASLERYTKLKPTDTSGLRQLASAQEQQARQENTRSQDLASQGSGGSFGTIAYAFPDTSGFLGAVGNNPIQQAVAGDFTARAGQAANLSKQLFDDAVATYERIAKLTPKDAQVYVQLGQTALNANRVDKAIPAFQTFLKLAPSDDPLVKSVKAELKQLQGSQNPATQSTG